MKKPLWEIPTITKRLKKIHSYCLGCPLRKSELPTKCTNECPLHEFRTGKVRRELPCTNLYLTGAVYHYCMECGEDDREWSYYCDQKKCQLYDCLKRSTADD